MQNIVIVLTGTIVVNATDSQHNDSTKRRREYLKCIHFYTKFSKVYFLENSSYDLDSDDDFRNIPNLTIRKFSPSLFPEKGKGYQEFEMIDRWIESEPDVIENFVKITGRYLYQNFHKLWEECRDNQNRKMIIQQYLFVEAGVALFFVNVDFYKNTFIELYKESDIKKDISIDYCIYKKLKSVPKKEFRRFFNDTRCIGIEGGSGNQMKSRINDSINYVIRKINYVFDKHYIWISF